MCGTAYIPYLVTPRKTDAGFCGMQMEKCRKTHPIRHKKQKGTKCPQNMDFLEK